MKKTSINHKFLLAHYFAHILRHLSYLFYWRAKSRFVSSVLFFRFVVWSPHGLHQSCKPQSLWKSWTQYLNRVLRSRTTREAWTIWCIKYNWIAFTKHLCCVFYHLKLLTTQPFKMNLDLQMIIQQKPRRHFDQSTGLKFVRYYCTFSRQK